MRTISGATGPTVISDNREIILLSSNNYLGLAAHPEIAARAASAAAMLGSGSGASRLISGTCSIHSELEERMAKFKRTEACLILNSGYQANTAIIPAIAPPEAVIFSDELNHASLIDGMRLSRAEVRIYPHRDVRALEHALTTHAHTHRPAWIITDSVFSMDGDVAPLAEIVELASRFNARVMVDEAHATGVCGPEGRGIAHEFGVAERIDLQMGTFSKALGSFGAYVAGSREMIDYLVNTARGFIFTTALPPMIIAASLAALDLAEHGDHLRRQLERNARMLREGLLLQGWNIVQSVSHIIPVIIGDAGLTIQISNRLFDLGIWAHGIRPPSVEEGTSRIRITPIATHTEQHMHKALEAFDIARKEFSRQLP